MVDDRIKYFHSSGSINHRNEARQFIATPTIFNLANVRMILITSYTRMYVYTLFQILTRIQHCKRITFPSTDGRDCSAITVATNLCMHTCVLNLII